MVRIATALAVLALGACASSSGAYSTGPDTYKITTTAITSFGGAGTAKQAAVKTAEATCAKQGKRAVVTSDSVDAQFTGASVDVAIRCES